MEASYYFWIGLLFGEVKDVSLRGLFLRAKVLLIVRLLSNNIVRCLDVL